MTPDRVHAIREALSEVTGKHVSQSDLAHVLGLTPENGGGRIRDFEDGKRETTGPIDRALIYLAQGLPSLHPIKEIPPYIVGDSAGAEMTSPPLHFITRLWWPRFIARVDDEETFLRGLGVAFFETNGVLITPLQWIDDPLLLMRSTRYYAEHAAAHYLAWRESGRFTSN